MKEIEMRSDKGKRSFDDIMFKIIQLLLYFDLNQTNLMYKANMSHTQQKRYMEYLVEIGMVKEIREGQYPSIIRSSYKVLPKGVEFYVQRRIEKALKDFNEMVR